MTLSIKEFIGDEDLVALTYRQVLEPVEGRGAPVHPPTYPGPRGKRAREDECRAEYAINEIGNGVRICELDTVQSQANRDGVVVPGRARRRHPAARGRGGRSPGRSDGAASSSCGRVDPCDGSRRCHPGVFRGVRGG